MTTGQIYDMKTRAYKRHSERWETIRKVAYPETGGVGLYIHNWYGCAKGKTAQMADAVLQGEWNSWRKIEKRFRRWYDQAEHRRHGSRFRPLWCDYCKAS